MQKLNKKIRILYIITGLTAGGAELHLSKIIDHLSSSKFEKIVCSLTSTYDILPLIKKNAKSIYILDARKERDFIKIILQVRKVIKMVNPDILHCIMFHSNIVGRFAAIGLKKKIISSVRTRLIYNKIGNFLDFISQLLVNFYLVNSNSLYKFISNYGIRRGKIYIVENGIDFDVFRPNKTKEEIIKELNLPNFPVICTVANFKIQKDYPTIIRAINLIKNELDFTFLIVGKGLRFENQEHVIKQLINRYNLTNVKFLGFRNDIANILSVTDIWVNSTLFEGQSNGLLEAMAMRLPIITTNIEENSELVRHNKEAILIPVKSPPILANKIKLLLKDKVFAEELAKKAFLRVKKNYTQQENLNKIKKIYHQIYSQIKRS